MRPAGPALVPEDTLYEWFAASARRFPDFEAVRLPGSSVSYRRLADLADALAGQLVRTFGGVPRRVALLASRSPRYREHVRWLRVHGATLVL